MLRSFGTSLRSALRQPAASTSHAGFATSVARAAEEQAPRVTEPATAPSPDATQPSDAISQQPEVTASEIASSSAGPEETAFTRTRRASSQAATTQSSGMPGSGAAPMPRIQGSLYGRGYVNAHRLHVLASRNNTLLTLTTPLGDPLASSSGGMAGFKKAQRSGYEAGYRAAFQIFAAIRENRQKWGLNGMEIFWNGFGQGREAVFRALMAAEGEDVRVLVRRMTDKTPLKIGGVRPKKRRML